MVLYAVPSTDITQTIIDAYNQKSGVPAPPPDAPGAGAGQPAVDAPQPQQRLRIEAGTKELRGLRD